MGLEGCEDIGGMAEGMEEWVLTEAGGSGGTAACREAFGDGATEGLGDGIEQVRFNVVVGLKSRR